MGKFTDLCDPYLVSFNVDFKIYFVEILPLSEMNNKNGRDF